MWRSAQLGLDSQASDHDLITQRTGGHARTRRPARGALSGPAWRVCGPEPRRAGRTCTGHPGRKTAGTSGTLSAAPRPQQVLSAPAPREGSLARPSPASPPHWLCLPRCCVHPHAVGGSWCPPAIPQGGQTPDFGISRVPQPTLSGLTPNSPSLRSTTSPAPLCTSPPLPPLYPPTWPPGHAPPAPASQGWGKGPPRPGHKEETQLTVSRGSAFLTCIWGMRAAARR